MMHNWFKNLDTDQWLSLLGDIAVPLSIFVVGAILARALEQLKLDLERSAFLVEKRWLLYESLAPDLNKIFQFCTYVGDWRSWGPEEIIDAKRRTDEKMYGSIPVLEGPILKAYVDFMATCFDQKRGRGLPIQIRANIERFKESDNWEEEWERFFVARETLEIQGGSYRRDRLQPAYSELLTAFGSSISGHRSISSQSALEAIRN
jgi:hypothetical protein